MIFVLFPFTYFVFVMYFYYKGTLTAGSLWWILVVGMFPPLGVYIMFTIVSKSFDFSDAFILYMLSPKGKRTWISFVCFYSLIGLLIFTGNWFLIPHLLGSWFVYNAFGAFVLLMLVSPFQPRQFLQALNLPPNFFGNFGAQPFGSSTL